MEEAVRRVVEGRPERRPGSLDEDVEERRGHALGAVRPLGDHRPKHSGDVDGRMLGTCSIPQERSARTPAGMVADRQDSPFALPSAHATFIPPAKHPGLALE